MTTQQQSDDYPHARPMGQAGSYSTPPIGSTANLPEGGAVVTYLTMRNDSGGTVAKGSCVVLEPPGSVGGAPTLAFTTSTSRGDPRAMGITLATAGASERVRVAVAGRVQQARVAAGSAIGQLLFQSATAGILEGVNSTLNPTFAVQLTARDANGYASVLILRQTSNLASFLGDGSDGDTTLSVNTTLTRDMYYSHLVVQGGVTLHTAGYRIFCTGEVDVAGTIEHDGTTVVGSTNGGAGAAAGSIGGGTAGGNATVAGTNETNAVGGAGGAGGTDIVGVPGAGGTATVPAAAVGGTQVLKNLMNALTMRDLSGALLTGGAGGGGGSNAAGGGGGGGAGCIMIAAASIIGVGAIHANGGTGSAFTGAASGGGGGGGGGCIVLISATTATTATVQVNGGAGGANFTGGTGTGVAGTVGSIVQIVA